MDVETTLNMRSFEGTILGHYRLIQFLDEGAFGAVYRASHMAYGVELREVAVKVSKRPMSDDEARRVFRDALIMTKVVDSAPDAALREHFVTVHDAGRFPEDGPLGGHPYLVMELVRGTSLKGSLRDGPFPLSRAITYFDQMLKALAFMHGGIGTADKNRETVIHRDLKPGNILVIRRSGAPDVVKVSDFGLAVEVDSLLGWVESGGDLAYLAPESFSHNICSPQTDVYMLALVFYEMLTHKSPFSSVGRHLRGTDEEKRDELRRIHLAARQMETFADLEKHEELRQRPELARVIRTALAADMVSRKYRNAVEFFSAWQQAKSGTDVSAGEQPWETVRRLTDEAVQCFGVNDRQRGEDLLRQADGMNRDSNRVPDRMVSGRTYLLMVDHLIRKGQIDEAGKLAMEGYQRRKCRSTCKAAAKYYESIHSPLAARMEQEATHAPDQS